MRTHDAIAPIRRLPSLLLALLTLSPALTLSGCGTPAQTVKAPQLPPPPAPAECTKAEFKLYPTGLEDLPTDFLQRTPKQRAQAILNINDDNGANYKELLAQALRCAV